MSWRACQLNQIPFITTFATVNDTFLEWNFVPNHLHSLTELAHMPTQSQFPNSKFFLDKDSINFGKKENFILPSTISPSSSDCAPPHCDGLAIWRNSGSCLAPGGLTVEEITKILERMPTPAVDNFHHEWLQTDLMFEPVSVPVETQNLTSSIRCQSDSFLTITLPAALKTHSSEVEDAQGHLRVRRRKP